MSDGEEGFGAIREVCPDDLLVYVENAGEFLVPRSAVEAVHFGKVAFDCRKLDDRLRRAIGVAEERFANARMGLAAHLEGVMNGTFLVALGAAWTEVRLSGRLKAAAYWSALYGTYANWAVTTLAAIFGTAALSPITGAGHRGQPWQETVVTAGFLSVGIVIIAASILVLWGLRTEAAR